MGNGLVQPIENNRIQPITIAHRPENKYRRRSTKDGDEKNHNQRKNQLRYILQEHRQKSKNNTNYQNDREQQNNRDAFTGRNRIDVWNNN